jgi:hypothetical protein
MQILTIMDPMSSRTRQLLQVHQVKCRARFETLFLQFFLSPWHIMDTFEILNLEIFLKINFDQVVGIY